MSDRTGDTTAGKRFDAAHATRSLDHLAMGQAARIVGIDPAAAGQPAERARQLADLGFVPDEPVAVLARAWPGGDPLVVRVGEAKFALRRAEAACVRVRVVA